MSPAKWVSMNQIALPTALMSAHPREIRWLYSALRQGPLDRDCSASAPLKPDGPSARWSWAPSAASRICRCSDYPHVDRGGHDKTAIFTALAVGFCLHRLAAVLPPACRRIPRAPRLSDSAPGLIALVVGQSTHQYVCSTHKSGAEAAHRNRRDAPTAEVERHNEQIWPKPVRLDDRLTSYDTRFWLRQFPRYS